MTGSSTSTSVGAGYCLAGELSAAVRRQTEKTAPPAVDNTGEVELMHTVLFGVYASRSEADKSKRSLRHLKP
jgi:hypothetical protein